MEIYLSIFPGFEYISITVIFHHYYFAPNHCDGDIFEHISRLWIYLHSIDFSSLFRTLHWKYSLKHPAFSLLFSPSFLWLLSPFRHFHLHLYYSWAYVMIIHNSKLSLKIIISNLQLKKFSYSYTKLPSFNHSHALTCKQCSKLSKLQYF